MSEVLGAANIHALRNKNEFRKQFGEYIVGKRDIIKMNDRVVRARVRSSKDFIRAHQSPDFGRKLIKMLNENFPNFEEENPTEYQALKELYIDNSM